MSDWKETTLGNLAEVQTGPFGSQLKNEQYITGGTPVVTVEHIKDFLIEDFIYPSVTDEDKKRLKKYTLKSGDIVFSRVGSVDLSALVKKHQDGWLFSSRMLRVRVKEKLDTQFLSYHLRQSTIRQFIINISVGSTMPSINTEILKSLPIVYCSLEEQKRIANILSCLDAKIENLRRQNETLEQIAQTLFKHWFIDFEFPNADGKPYKSSGGAMSPSELGDIPEGWRVLTLQQICKTIYRYPQFYGMEKVESGVPVIRGEHLLKNGRISNDFSDYWFVKDEYSAKFPKTILEEFDVVLSVRGSVGNYSVVGKKHIGVQISPNTIRLSANPKNLKQFLLYTCLKSNQFKHKLLMTVSSSAVPAINAVEFKTFEFVVPDMSIQNRLSNVFKDLYRKIDANENQIQTLTKTRDALLPKLMSGQLRVKE
jgi:type I restriction enzyme S subunit